MRSLVIVAALLAACGARAEPDREVERAAAALASADPIAASAVVTGLARGGCPGLGRALDALDRSRISGRTLSGLVDDAVAAAGEAGCGASAIAALGPRDDGKDSAARQLARARALADRPREALAALAPGAGEPAVRLRRAEVLAALERPGEALPELQAYLARVPDDGRARAALVEGLVALGRTREALAAVGPAPHRDPAAREAHVAALAAAGRMAECAAAVAAAPLPERPALARRAAALAPPAELDRIARAPADDPAHGPASDPAHAPASDAAHGPASHAAHGPASDPPRDIDVELLAAFADRVEADRGAAAALPLRERAARSAPARAELADALARALAAAGRIDAAVTAWDAAATAAPAAAVYRLAPIRALAGAGRQRRARERALAVLARARESRDADELVTASAAAAAAGDSAWAARVAREARAARPGDGRLAMLVGERLAAAGDRAGAAATWTELLVCGAHRRPWHRHEVAARLVGLADGAESARQVMRALSAPLPCPAADPDDLASYLDEARRRVRAAAH
ncbi:MAG TPA: tetratricopeptide repeat protein [Kofleriaceae bacterium]|nr:tetratricopeptide repeat protein [Kofleriaceae bacterium]